MTAPKDDGPRSTGVETLERPAAPAVVVRYFKIDFHRCVIRRGSRVKQAERPAGRAKG